MQKAHINREKVISQASNIRNQVYLIFLIIGLLTLVFFLATLRIVSSYYEKQLALKNTKLASKKFFFSLGLKNCLFPFVTNQIFQSLKLDTFFYLVIFFSICSQEYQICTFFCTGKCTRKWSHVSNSLHGKKTFFVFFSKMGFLVQLVKCGRFRYWC